MLKITLVKSSIGSKPVNRKTVTALGLRRIGRIVYREDTPSVRGMVRNVAHLLKVETVDSAPPAAKKVKKAAPKVVMAAPAKKPVEAKPKTDKPAEHKPAAKKPAKKKPAAKKPAAPKPAPKKESPKAATNRKSFGQLGKGTKKK